MPPRALLLSTGEDVPRGQSLRARLLVVEMPIGGLDWDLLSEMQPRAESGLYAGVLAAFVRWMAPRRDDHVAWYHARRAELRGCALGRTSHRRTPDIVASLASGIELFIAFAIECGALTTGDAAGLWSEVWDSLGRAAAEQAAQQSSQDPARRYLELLSSVFSSGRGHVASLEGNAPADCESWGWRRGTEGEWLQQGTRIGWVSGDDLYLDPEAAYAAVQRMAGEGGDHLGVTAGTLHRRLRERGVLKTTEDDHLAVKKSIEGIRLRVLHLSTRSLDDVPRGIGATGAIGAEGRDEAENVPVPRLAAPVLSPCDDRSGQGNGAQVQ